MDVADMYALLVQGNSALGGGGYLADPTTWGAWAHEGHRLWASMSEEFWVYVYKVRRCPQPCSHDWTACPYAHKGERARRRDPRRFAYVAVSCPDYRAQAQAQLAAGGGQPPPSCRRGLKCRYAHGVFELWLHPSRFRTRMCEAGRRCPRPICFFAHLPAELRVHDHIAAGALSLPMISLPPSPPRLLQRAPSPPLASPLPAAVSRGQMFDDLTLQSTHKQNRLRLLSLYSAVAADTVFSSAATSAAAVAATAAAAAAATVPTLMALPAGGGEDAKGVRCAEEEDSVMNDYQYPHVDLIMDLVS
ncbi:hypothetical protein QYE76_038936 [Lolium multiflorum]|uniref:AtC3H23-like CCCH zinc finger domain-containing protein n=1 Tax=Lolium multiflorum TaxID=4521 RepID=A0AAD8T9W9_LOLMU|nr:hypothetical protein QYE76_038936 [Lolium multiflorum]